jgi:uncharacterized membrane protein YdjX (TVP38/TMEM64 family)
VVAAWWTFIAGSGGDPAGTASRLFVGVLDSPWLPLWLLLAYVLRGLVLLPASVLALVSGFALGPWWGALVSLTGILLTSAVVYVLAWAWRARPAVARLAARVPDVHAERLKKRTFEATLLVRLLAVPGDAVNVAAGAMRVPVVPFLAATALGGAPGLLAFTWAAASVEGDLASASLTLDARWLLASLLVALVGVVFAARARRLQRA